MYHWQGSDASLKPILLTAHQGDNILRRAGVTKLITFADVVPVDPTTWDNWVNPPFSGYYDGTMTQFSGLYSVDAMLRRVDLGPWQRRRQVGVDRRTVSVILPAWWSRLTADAGLR